ncbi:hypothetical protein PRZ48_003816 [Zasmidium cellare]|uniref:Uncharacterized protein n=1 Tax=Zasmidium cellare TaxID=395010 RepID=A0ABR0EXQ0_ZASCE|nr:hypothetical protein PRZ48_003816 [Zasmidium cellare]
MTATNYAPASHQQTSSHMREPHHNPATTRTVHAADSNHHHHNHHQTLSAPASQESFVSVQSTGSSIAPGLQGSDSNLSQITTYTDLTSPSSSAASKAAKDAAQSANNSQIPRDTTPENATRTPHLNGDNALASPMSIASPVATNGAKRTASGHVKNAHSLSNTPYQSMFPGRDSRRESISSSGSKAGELAATLKTRLGYAMAKVQHGWEHKTLNEVEQLAAHRARNNRNSMSHIDSRPSTSGLSNGTAGLSVYESASRGSLHVNGQPPSKRHSGTYSGYAYAPQQSAPTPHLQPAPDIRPTSSSRPQAGPQLYPTTSNGSAMSPPRTPINAAGRRPPTIRTETQTIEAERDALQALFQLGSPHTSQMPYAASSSQASPMKTDMDTPRRVTFAWSESNSSGEPPSSRSSAAQDARRGS